jgi:hypothetical protein
LFQVDLKGTKKGKTGYFKVNFKNGCIHQADRHVIYHLGEFIGSCVARIRGYLYLGILYFSAVSVKNIRNNINTNFRKYEISFQRIARARGAPRGGEFI